MTESFHRLTWQTREEVKREPDGPAAWVLKKVVVDAHEGPNSKK
jgi:hypothetical protein